LPLAVTVRRLLLRRPRARERVEQRGRLAVVDHVRIDLSHKVQERSARFVDAMLDQADGEGARRLLTHKPPTITQQTEATIPILCQPFRCMCVMAISRPYNLSLARPRSRRKGRDAAYRLGKTTVTSYFCALSSNANRIMARRLRQAD
jgi:hypothetical protein